MNSCVHTTILTFHMNRHEIETHQIEKLQPQPITTKCKKMFQYFCSFTQKSIETSPVYKNKKISTLTQKKSINNIKKVQIVNIPQMNACKSKKVIIV